MDTVMQMIEEKNEGAKLAIRSLGCRSYVSEERKTTWLHFAAECGNGEVTRYLIGQGCDANVQDVFGTTPLMVAVSENQESVVEILLAVGADITLAAEEGVTVLDVAFHLHRTSPTILALLLAAVEQRYRSTEGIAECLMDVNCELHQAVFLQDVAVIECMLRHKCPINSTNSVDNRTALHVAVEMEDLDMVTLLLQYNANVGALDDLNGTPLFHLYRRNQPHSKERIEISKMLLGSGASLFPLTALGTFQSSNLLVKGNREEIRAVLRTDVDFSAKDEAHGLSVLHYLALNTNSDVANELKYYAANNHIDVNMCDDLNRSPLIAAVQVGNVDMVKLLLEHGADVNSISNGHTALFCAYEDSKRGFESLYDACAELLLQYGADPQFIASTDAGQVTVIDLASRENSLHRMDTIIAHIAMLENRGTKVTDIVRTQINGHSLLKEYYEDCRRVLDTKVTDSLTLSDLLDSSKYKLARNIDDEFIRMLNSLMANVLKPFYRYFYNITENQYCKAKQYKAAAMSICGIFKNKIDADHLVAREIIDYLDDQTLGTLSKCFQN